MGGKNQGINEVNNKFSYRWEADKGQVGECLRKNEAGKGKKIWGY